MTTGIDRQELKHFIEEARRDPDASASRAIADTDEAFNALDTDKSGRLDLKDAEGRLDRLDAAIALLESGRAAHKAGDKSYAERAYSLGLAFTARAPSPATGPQTTRSVWNLATLREERGEVGEAARLLGTLRTAPDGTLNPDVELHARYARLRMAEYEQIDKSGRPGPMTAKLTPTGLSISSTAVDAIREAAAAYNDLLKVLSDPAVGKNLNLADRARFATEAKAGLTWAVCEIRAFAGRIQAAAVGPMLDATRERHLKAGKIGRDHQSFKVELVTTGAFAEDVQKVAKPVEEQCRAAGIGGDELFGLWTGWALSQRID
jgi:hypothetical protein